MLILHHCNEYEERIYKLPPLVGNFIPEEQRNTSFAYQRDKYFSYRGKMLNEIRKEKENLCKFAFKI